MRTVVFGESCANEIGSDHELELGRAGERDDPLDTDCSKTCDHAAVEPDDAVAYGLA